MKEQAPIALGNRRELFIDSYLVDTAIGAALRLNPPQRREVVLKMDQTWESGWLLARYSAEDCDVIYGDEQERDVTWRGQSDLSFLKGKKVQFKFELIDADLYALQVV
jgi:hypothetical protein